MATIKNLSAPGFVTLTERTTPIAKTDIVKLYAKTDNKLYYQDGDGTEHTLLKGLTSTEHTFMMPFEDPTSNVGFWDFVSIGTSGEVHFVFQVPEDFEVLGALTVVMIPDASETIQYDLNISVSAVGELYDNDDRSVINQQVLVTVSQITEIDISGSATGLSAGDYVAIDFQSDTGSLRIIGCEFDYN